MNRTRETLSRNSGAKCAREIDSLRIAKNV
jgi:hypothetical protein